MRSAELISPDGDRFTYVYDANQRMTLVVNPQGARTSFGYDAADRRTVKKLGNGARASLTYDNGDRLTRLVNIKSSGVTISSFNYKYDNVANRIGVVEATGDRVTWVYDATYQLTHEKRSGVNSYDVTYTYDPLGNRLVKIDGGSRTTSVYGAANRLTYAQDSTGRTTFVFDSAGNQTQQKTPTLQITTSVWDFENMNTATILPTLSRVTLTYNGDQQRVEKDTAGLTRKYVFDGQNIVLETDGSNLTQAVYTLEPLDYGNLLSQRQLQAGIWVPINYSFDGLGSTDSLTDGSQVITDTYTYYAFGLIKTSSGTTTNLFTWIGQLGYVRDIETGEYELSLRQYLPDRARFKSQDPLGLDPDMNPYRYVLNDPVSDSDPSGLQGQEMQQNALNVVNFPCVVKVNGVFVPGDELVKGSELRERLKFASALSSVHGYEKWNWKDFVIGFVAGIVFAIPLFALGIYVLGLISASLAGAVTAFLGSFTGVAILAAAGIVVLVNIFLYRAITFAYLLWKAANCDDLDVAAQAYGKMWDAWYDLCATALVLPFVLAAAYVTLPLLPRFPVAPKTPAPTATPAVGPGIKPGQVASAYPRGRRVGGRHHGVRPTDPARGTQVEGTFDLTPENLARMEKGKPPIGSDGKRVVLHHRDQNPKGPLDVMTETAPGRVPHPKRPSEIDRPQFDRQRARFWVQLARELLGQQ